MLADDVPIVPGPSERYLNLRQKHDYEDYRTDFLERLATLGKDPTRSDGYSHAVVKNTAYWTDKFYR